MATAAKGEPDIRFVFNLGEELWKSLPKEREPFHREFVRGLLLEPPSGDRGFLQSLVDLPWILGTSIGFIPYFRGVTAIARLGRSLRLLRALEESSLLKYAVAGALQRGVGVALRGGTFPEAARMGLLEGVYWTGFGLVSGTIGRYALSGLRQATSRIFRELPPAARRVAPVGPSILTAARKEASERAATAAARPVSPAAATRAPEQLSLFETAVPEVRPRIPAAAIPTLEELPPPKEDMIRFYHGTGGVAGAGVSEAWWTTNPARARSFGPEVKYVDVPKTEALQFMQAAKEAGSGTVGDAILPDVYVRQASPVHVEPQVYKIGDVDNSLLTWAAALREKAQKTHPAELYRLQKVEEMISKGDVMGATKELVDIQRVITTVPSKVGVPMEPAPWEVSPPEVSSEMEAMFTARLEGRRMEKPTRPSKIEKAREAKRAKRAARRKAAEEEFGVRFGMGPKWAEIIDARYAGRKLRLPTGEEVEALGVVHSRDYGDVVIYVDPKGGEPLPEFVKNITWL